MRFRILAAAAVMAVTACTTQQQSPTASAAGRVPWPETSADVLRVQTAVTPWTAYRTFNFGTSTADVSTADTAKIYEIVAYLKANPSFDVGIDLTEDTQGLSKSDQTLGSRRAASLRRALMDAGAGVASYKIFIGAFGDPGLRRADQVQVFVGSRTGSLNAAR